MPRICVVGDVIVDEYLYSFTRKPNPEREHGWAYQVDVTERRFGGAAAVAIICQQFASEDAVYLVGVVGTDKYGRWLKHQLRVRGIEDHVWSDPEYSTLVKTRLVYKSEVCDQRLDLGCDYPSSDKVRMLIPENGAVVIADYNKGTISPHTMQVVHEWAPMHDAYVFVDPAYSDDWRGYMPCDVIKCNRREALRVLRCEGVSCEDQSAEKIVNELASLYGNVDGCDCIVVTDGANGAAWWSRAGGVRSAQVREPVRVVDVCGAGDTFMASLSVDILDGMSLDDACLRAIDASTWQVQSLGIRVPPPRVRAPSVIAPPVPEGNGDAESN